MKPEIEEQWRLIKSSHPNAVAFIRSQDIYFALGSDVETIKQELGVRCFGTTIGFNSDEAWYYMRQLAKAGHAVFRGESSGVWPVSPNGRGREPKRPEGSFVAVDVRRLFHPSGLLRMRVEEERHSVLVELLGRSDYRGLREYGELYVFEAFGGYDVDWELTTMLPSRALQLARAALDCGAKLPCRLVLPRAWRGRRRQRATIPPKPSTFGQLKMDLD